MKKIIFSLLAAAALVVSGPTAVFAFDNLPVNDPNNPLSTACDNVANAQNSAVCKQNTTQKNDPNNSNPVSGTNGIIKKAADLIAQLTGVIAGIMIIVGGLMLTVAGGGDSATRAKKARSIIAAAITGIIIVGLSWTIVTFVITRFTK